MQNLHGEPQFKLAASLICGNMLDLRREIQLLENGPIDHIHFDVMDGHFVPRLGFHPELLKAVKSVTQIPVDVHMMIDRPEQFIPAFVEAGAEIITVHAESTRHLHYAIKMVRDLGAKAGVGINPGTPLDVLDYVLDDIELVTLMAINPGIVGHQLIPKVLDKIKDLKQKLYNHPNVVIEIDGGVRPETAATMINNGADMLVCGTGSIFKPDLSVNAKIKEFRAHVTNQLRTN